MGIYYEMFETLSGRSKAYRVSFQPVEFIREFLRGAYAPLKFFPMARRKGQACPPIGFILLLTYSIINLDDF